MYKSQAFQGDFGLKCHLLVLSSVFSSPPPFFFSPVFENWIIRAYQKSTFSHLKYMKSVEVGKSFLQETLGGDGLLVGALTELTGHVLHTHVKIRRLVLWCLYQLYFLFFSWRMVCFCVLQWHILDALDTVSLRAGWHLVRYLVLWLKGAGSLCILPSLVFVPKRVSEVKNNHLQSERV